jgi:hypothetical protein
MIMELWTQGRSAHKIIYRTIFLVFCLIGLFFLTISTVNAATIYIDGSLIGNCTNNYSINNHDCSGSDGNAYTTISGGFAGATVGDTINIREGTYSVNGGVSVNFSSTTLTTTIQSYNSEVVTITNTTVSSTTFNLGSSARNILIKDLKFVGTPYHVLTGWANFSGNVWTTTIPYTSTQVRFNTTNGTLAASIVAVDAANEYYISGSTMYAYSVGDPASTYTTPGINLAENFSGSAIGNPSHGAVGFLITIDNCQFDNFSHTAIKGTWKWHIKNSRFYNNGTDANDHHIYPNGIQTSGNEMIFEHNYFGYSPGAGIHLYTAPAYAFVRYNVFNGLSGVTRGAYGVLLAGPNSKVYNNTFYGYGANGGLMIFRSGAQNNEIKNNIFYNNTNDLAIDTGGSSYPLNNTVSSNYLGSASKCTGCIDLTGSGGQNYTTLDDAPPNFHSSSPWTQFTYSFTKATTGATNLTFFNICGGGAAPSTGVWYLDDISLINTGDGTEKVTNGNMEGSFSSGIASSWGAFGGTTGTQETTITHSGANSQRLNVASGCGSRFEQLVNLPAGNYQLSGWAKRTSGTGTLVVYVAGVNTSATIGDPNLFSGTAPYSSASDFKTNVLGTDFLAITDVGESLAVTHQIGFNSMSATWPLSKINQSYFGSSWDLGAFVYNSDSTTPATTDNIDSIWHNSDVSVTLACNDFSGSSCAYTYYTTDGSTPTPSSSQGTNFIISTQGTYVIKYFSVDNAGNTEAIKTASNTVRIDKTAPTGSILIDAGSESTTNSFVTLTIDASDTQSAGIEMQISESIDFVGSNYEAFVSSKSFTLSNVAGDKTIYVKFKDEAGNISNTYFDMITKQSLPIIIPNIPAQPTDEIPTIVVSIDKPEESAEELSNIFIRLVDSEGNPIVNAKVIIEELNIQAITDSSGIVNIGKLDTGDYEISIEYQGRVINQILGVNQDGTIVTIEIPTEKPPQSSLNPLIFVIPTLLGLIAFWYVKRQDK